jgi:hypothetical protein
MQNLKAKTKLIFCKGYFGTAPKISDFKKISNEMMNCQLFFFIIFKHGKELP